MTRYYFWFLIFAIVLFIVFIAVVETSSDFHNNGSLEWWVWLIFAFAITFLFISIVMYYFQYANTYCMPVPSCAVNTFPPIVETIIEPVRTVVVQPSNDRLFHRNLIY